jgi:hypothetical protein
MIFGKWECVKSFNPSVVVSQVSSGAGFRK